MLENILYCTVNDTSSPTLPYLISHILHYHHPLIQSVKPMSGIWPIPIIPSDLQFAPLGRSLLYMTNFSTRTCLIQYLMSCIGEPVTKLKVQWPIRPDQKVFLSLDHSTFLCRYITAAFRAPTICHRKSYL